MGQRKHHTHCELNLRQDPIYCLVPISPLSSGVWACCFGSLGFNVNLIPMSHSRQNVWDFSFSKYTITWVNDQRSFKGRIEVIITLYTYHSVKDLPF